MGATTSASDLHRLADEAIRRGIRLFKVPSTAEWYASSATDPALLHRVTAFSCDCRGFMHWQRCSHNSLLLAEIGYLPDLPDPEPDPAGPALLPPTSEEPDPWDAPAPVSPVAVPANVLRFPDPGERREALAAAVDGAVERLAGQLAEGFTAEFRGLLSFMGRFHKYSARNCVLILSQCPQATLVAGHRRWAELGYKVRKGEKALWIWAPMTRKGQDPATGEPVEEVAGFRPAPVFDACQLADLDEKPLPTAERRLPDDCRELYLAARDRVVAWGIRVEERPLPPGVDGESRGGVILLRPGLDSRTRLLVLLHELCHELAHHGGEQEAKPVGQRELEAESVAFVVAAALGIDGGFARDYLLSYKITADDLRASLGTIRQLVRRVLAVVGDVAEGEALAPAA